MSHLRIPGPSVVHETIEGEVVIVNLDKGLYFSTDGIGAHVWGMIIAGRSVEEIYAWGTGAFADDAIAADLDTFLDDLRTNELVRDDDEAPDTDEVELPAAPTVYVKPALHVYADMEELLLLDPIHDVSDDAGWPHAQA